MRTRAKKDIANKQTGKCMVISRNGSKVSSVAKNSSKRSGLNRSQSGNDDSKRSRVNKIPLEVPGSPKSVYKCSRHVKSATNYSEMILDDSTPLEVLKVTGKCPEGNSLRLRSSVRKNTVKMPVIVKGGVNKSLRFTSRNKKFPEIDKTANQLAEVAKSIFTSPATRPPVWQSMDKSDIQMSLNVSSHRKSKRISSVKNKDVYNIEFTLSPKKDQPAKAKVRRAVKPKQKNISKPSFKHTTLTTDLAWKNPLTIPTSQFYRKPIDNSAIVVHNSHYDHTDDDHFSHSDWDANVSVVDAKEDSCSLPLMSGFEPNQKYLQQNMFKTTSTPYGFRTYAIPTVLTDEEEVQMCFGFEEPEAGRLLFSPVEKPPPNDSVGIPSQIEHDNSHETCPTRLTTVTSSYPIIAKNPQNTNIINSYSNDSRTALSDTSNIQRRLTKVNKKAKIKKSTYDSHITGENTTKENVRKAKKPKTTKKSSTRTKPPKNSLKKILTKENKKQDTSVMDDWASDINNHFSEIDEMDLCVE